MAVLVIEMSTSSIKVMAVDAKCDIICEFSERIGISSDGVQQPDEICAAVLRMGRKTIELYSQSDPATEITAIGIVSTWHNSLVVDAAGNARTPSYTWTYREPGTVAAFYKKQDPGHARAYYKKTGCLVNGTYVSFRMKYFTENGFTFGKNEILIDQGTYLFHKLTGVFQESYSMASGTGLFALQAMDWDSAIAAEMGVPLEALPELCDYASCQPLCARAASMLGLKQGIPVVTAHPDGAMNQIGDDALEDGIMTLSVGTSAALRMISARAAVPDLPSLWCYYAPGSYLTGAATSGCANCVDWFVHNVCGNLYDYKDFDQMAEQELESPENASCDPPIFLPFLFGERAPGWSEGRQGGFLHLNGRHGTGAMYRAVLEGICFNIRQCYDVLCRVNHAPERIHVSGGVVRSKVWSRILANVLQKELLLSPVQNTSSIGGAKLALFAAGEIPDIHSHVVKARETVSPDPAMSGIYDRLYREYCDCYDKTRPEL